MAWSSGFVPQKVGGDYGSGSSPRTFSAPPCRGRDRRLRSTPRWASADLLAVEATAPRLGRQRSRLVVLSRQLAQPEPFGRAETGSKSNEARPPQRHQRPGAGTGGSIPMRRPTYTCVAGYHLAQHQRRPALAGPWHRVTRDRLKSGALLGQDRGSPARVRTETKEGSCL
jgi:hypothetical protein